MSKLFAYKEKEITASGLRSAILRFNLLYRLLGLALLIFAVFGWALTVAVLAISAKAIVGVLDLANISVQSDGVVFWSLLVVFLGAMTIYGFRREGGFMELSGLMESPLHYSSKAGGYGRFEANSLNLRLEILLFAPLATKQGLALLFGTPLRIRPETFDDAVSLYKTLQGENAWVGLGVQSPHRAAADLLARFELIRLSPNPDGSFLMRIPSKSEFE